MKVLALDIGYAATGAAVMERGDSGAWGVAHLRCVRPAPPSKEQKRRTYVACMDAERMKMAAAELAGIIVEHGINRMVVEIPNSGAMGATSLRCMSYAGGMVAGLAGVTGAAVEWYLPHETRKAATGKSACTKAEVIAAIALVFPEVLDVPTLIDREACADALATFLAAKAGNLVRL